MAPLAEALRNAASLVARVAAGHALDAPALWQREQGEAETHGALLDLCLGTLRSYGRVQAIVHALTPASKVEPEVQALLWCALYAHSSGRYAAYTVVDQAVRACALLGKPRAKNFVNAVLRNFLRRQSAIEARIAADPAARWQHPRWWVERVQQGYPRSWREILEWGNSRPPMCLRVNLRRCAREAYHERLAAAGISARALGGSALLLERPQAATRLPGFADGDVSVQDLGAQRVATLLDLHDGQRVLDACAAPGGKSAHILETAAVNLTALELREERAAAVVSNLTRLGLRAEVRIADCGAPESWWDGRPFDRVLADVPCTASGVARRHPDIKWLRRERDIATSATRQAHILAALWRVLAPDGKLLYVTCSVFGEENEAVIEHVMARIPGARRLPLSDGGASQTLPSGEQDGFFCALLAKAA